jgi:hypothetical protein
MECTLPDGGLDSAHFIIDMLRLLYKSKKDISTSILICVAFICQRKRERNNINLSAVFNCSVVFFVKKT